MPNYWWNSFLALYRTANSKSSQMINQSDSDCFVEKNNIHKSTNKSYSYWLKNPKIEFLSYLVVAYKIRLRLVKSEQ